MIGTSNGTSNDGEQANGIRSESFYVLYLKYFMTIIYLRACISRAWIDAKL